jgi:hypothetical protein
MADEKEKATLNFDISKELNDMIEIETKRLQISKADFIRMRLIEYFEVKNASNKPIELETGSPETR